MSIGHSFKLHLITVVNSVEIIPLFTVVKMIGFELYFNFLVLTQFYSFQQPDEYDKLVKELGSDRRAHASDRTKTPEEIAQEEKERLEELEVNFGFFFCS